MRYVHSSAIERLRVTSPRYVTNFRMAKCMAAAYYALCKILMAKLSDYFYSLDGESKKRYMQKLSLFQGQDPYALKKGDLSKCESFFPDFK